MSTRDDLLDAIDEACFAAGFVVTDEMLERFADVLGEPESRARRYRLAWESARLRAASMTGEAETWHRRWESSATGRQTRAADE